MTTEDLSNPTTWDPLIAQVAEAVPVPPLRPLPAGAMAGDYRIESVLGQGGFGTVYRAVHRIIGKPVAVKVLHERYCDCPAIVARFTEEGSAVNRIAHPNIVDIFGFGTLETGQPFLVMELLEGESLRQRLQREGPLVPAEALELLRRIASALDATHAQNILHLDLKPENIFLVRRNHERLTPKLLDFGIAKVFGSPSRETGDHALVDVIGTREYMAPEQRAGTTLDPRVDVYALGIVAYEMLTASRPFEPSGTVSASRRNAALPHTLDVPLERLFAAAPEQRPARASEAVELLAAVVRENAAASEYRRARLARYRWWGITWALLVLLAGAGWLIGRARFPSPRVPQPRERVLGNSVSPASSPTSSLPRNGTEVTLTLDVAPTQFELYVGDQLLQAPQGLLRLERGDRVVKLTFRAKGFEDEVLEVIPLRDQLLRIQLHRRTAPERKPKNTRVLPRSSRDLEF